MQNDKKELLSFLAQKTPYNTNYDYNIINDLTQKAIKYFKKK